MVIELGLPTYRDIGDAIVYYLDLLAQANLSNIPELTSGWSAFGLAGVILWWLAFHHLPAKDKQIKELIDSHNARVDAKDAQLDRIVASALASEDKQRSDFKSSLNTVVSHCAEENQKARDSWSKQLDKKIEVILTKIKPEGA